jgi:hypothetical protein
LTGEEKDTNCLDLLHLKFSATKLDKKDFFRKSDPYLEFAKYTGGDIFNDENFVTVHKTEVKMKTLNQLGINLYFH